MQVLAHSGLCIRVSENQQSCTFQDTRSLSSFPFATMQKTYKQMESPFIKESDEPNHVSINQSTSILWCLV